MERDMRYAFVGGPEEDPLLLHVPHRVVAVAAALSATTPDWLEGGAPPLASLAVTAHAVTEGFSFSLLPSPPLFSQVKG